MHFPVASSFLWLSSLIFISQFMWLCNVSIFNSDLAVLPVPDSVVAVIAVDCIQNDSMYNIESSYWIYSYPIFHPVGNKVCFHSINQATSFKIIQTFDFFEGSLTDMHSSIVINFCWQNRKKSTSRLYPGFPVASILFATLTSLDQTSNCHFFSPIRPENTDPVWIPTRISIS